jgi:hypothetical protein
VCINFNPGCYHLFLPLCCCITAVIIHKSCLISPRSIHLLHLFPPCYVHFMYSPHSLAFIFILYHSSHAWEQLAVTQRVSPLAYSIPPDFPGRSLSLQPIVHCTTSHLTRPHTCTSFIHAHYTYVFSHPSSSIERYFISIGAGLEIETLVEISVQVFLHA